MPSKTHFSNRLASLSHDCPAQDDHHRPPFQSPPIPWRKSACRIEILSIHDNFLIHIDDDEIGIRTHSNRPFGGVKSENLGRIEATYFHQLFLRRFSPLFTPSLNIRGRKVSTPGIPGMASHKSVLISLGTGAWSVATTRLFHLGYPPRVYHYPLFPDRRVGLAEHLFRVVRI